jgi:flagellar motility protein MotE (MotC chaperone)
MADSIRTLNTLLTQQQNLISSLREKSGGAPRADTAARTTASDSARAKESKSFAKMLESMPAEQAVRILKGLDDGEVKSVLLSVKKRQAAKILSALDPDRAARMMRRLE